MRNFTGEDVVLKNIAKSPSPKRKICFPGLRPHIARDVETGAPLSLEFRNGTARATTTFKQFIRDLLPETLSDPIPFLGGLKLQFEIVPYRDKKKHNTLQRIKLDFG